MTPTEPTPTETAPETPVDKPITDMTVDELAVAVRYHNWRYFALADASISDYEFDALTRRLKALAPDHDALVELTSDATPTTTTSALSAATGDKVFHDHPMISLDKCYSEAELMHWATSFEGAVTETPKIDGVAASFKYDGGRLLLAVTRGDGKRGEAFTTNAGFMSEVPKTIPFQGPVEVRGEIYMRLTVFERFAAAGFSNPRNTTAGAIKQKDPARTGDYELSFYLYDIFGLEFATEVDKAAWGREQGFQVVESTLLEKTHMQAGYDTWLVRRPNLDFEVDGVVYKVNGVAQQAQMGATAHHPRYALAYKFQGESGVSTLEEVEWSVSRTGAITPIAIITPISLSGAMVSRCSLHNLSIMEKLGATIGAKVVAMRRGGVIPHIESVAEAGPTAIEIPVTCPGCDGPAERRDDQLWCTTPENCTVARLGRLQHFTKAVEIDGFGPKIVTQLLDLDLIREPADYYALTIDDLRKLERMGDTLASKLLTNVAVRTSLPLDTFLRSLGINALGGVASTKIATELGTLEAVLEVPESDLAEIHGIGPITAASIVAGLESLETVISDLRKVVTVEAYKAPEVIVVEASEDDPVAGYSFVFTGKMATMGRKEAQALVLARGGSTPSGVGKGLDYLVIGDDGSALLGGGAPSSKHKKATKANEGDADIAIITETAFLEMVGATVGG